MTNFRLRREPWFFPCVETKVGLPARPGVAHFDTSGRYRARFFEDAQELIPGRYRITTEWWKTPPSSEVGPPAESHLPPRYASPTTSEWELEVSREKFPLIWNIPLRSP